MALEQTLVFNSPPALLSLYRRLFFSRRAGLRAGKSLPSLGACRPQAKADTGRLSTYRQLCGYPENGFLPMLYPYVMGAPLQMAIMAEREFPLSPLGLVHSRNHILQRRPIREDEVLHLECRIGTTRVVKAGLEVDFTTAAEAHGERVWECLSTYLARGKHYGEPGDPSPLAEMPALEDAPVCGKWHVEPTLGRRYARATGDFNPIHISRVLAKLFGFKRDIIHGMWSASACLPHLASFDAGQPLRYDVAFKGPIFMDSNVVLQAVSTPRQHRFDLYCAGNPRPCLTALYRVAEAGESLLD